MRLVGWSPPDGADQGASARAARVRRRARAARWRRPLAALLTAVAVLTALAALRPPGAAGVDVLVAAADLPAGATVSEADLRPVRLPPSALPPSAVGADRSDRVVGGLLAAPVGRGELVTTARLLGPGLLTGAPPGTLAVPVEVSSALPDGAVRAGDAVAVIVGARDDPRSVPGPDSTEVPGTQAPGTRPPEAAAAQRLLVARCVVLVPPRAGAPGSGLLGGGSGGSRARRGARAERGPGPGGGRRPPPRGRCCWGCCPAERGRRGPWDLCPTDPTDPS